MTENRSVVACGWENGVGRDSWMTRGIRKLLGVMNLFIISIVMKLLKVHIYVKTHQILFTNVNRITNY